MKRVLLMTVVGLLVASSAMAANENVRFALHLKAQTTKSATICTSYSPNATLTPCTSYTVSSSAQTRLVYAVIGDADPEGVAGVSFGIDYTPGMYVTWTKCIDGNDYPSDVPLWPAEGSAGRFTWLNCQQTVIAPASVHAVIGCFYVYAYGPSVFEITPNNTLATGIPELAVASCASVETDLIDYWTSQGHPEVVQLIMGKAGIFGGTGYNPCLATPVAETTWGNIKNKYQDQN